MVLLFNLVFALLAGWLALYLSRRATAPEPVAWIIAVIVGIIVFMADFATTLLTK